MREELRQAFEVARQQRDALERDNVRAAYITQIDRLRAENAELQHELTKGIHTCGPTCRKTPRCAEMADLRAELAELRRFRKVIMDYDSNLYDALANSDAARKGEEKP